MRGGSRAGLYCKHQGWCLEWNVRSMARGYSADAGVCLLLRGVRKLGLGGLGEGVLWIREVKKGFFF